jgi:peptidoglycan/LPS O-acetylase OafA/YrhL
VKGRWNLLPYVRHRPFDSRGSQSAVLPEVSKVPSQPVSALIYICANLALLPGLFPIEPLIAVAWTLSYELFVYLLIPVLIGATWMRQPGTKETPEESQGPNPYPSPRREAAAA